MKSKKEIQKDLRNLRKASRAVEAKLRVKESHERRRAYLEERKAPASELLRIANFIDSLDIEGSIRRASELENRYMEAINGLDDIDKTIILDGYINGKPYWKIGREIGYTEDGIKKRVSKILERLAETV